MDFNSRFKYLRRHPKFMVSQEIEIKAIAYSAREVNKINDDDFLLGKTENGFLIIKPSDIGKIVREYPDLTSSLK